MEAPISPTFEELLADPKVRAEFERGLERLDDALRPLTDAVEASTRLTAEDYAFLVG